MTSTFSRDGAASSLEVILSRAPGVAAAAAAVRGKADRVQMVGWVVAVDTPAFSMTAVYEHVVHSAAADVLPDFLLLVDEIPRCRDGALDHARLVWP